MMQKRVNKSRLDKDIISKQTIGWVIASFREEGQFKMDWKLVYKLILLIFIEKKLCGKVSS